MFLNNVYSQQQHSEIISICVFSGFRINLPHLNTNKTNLQHRNPKQDSRTDTLQRKNRKKHLFYYYW